MKQKILAAVCALALCAALVPAGFAEQAAADTAPVAENLELTTFRGTSIGGTLSANAPDGSPLTFRITTEPIKGTVTRQRHVRLYPRRRQARARLLRLPRRRQQRQRIAGGDRHHLHQEAEACRHLQRHGRPPGGIRRRHARRAGAVRRPAGRRAVSLRPRQPHAAR